MCATKHATLELLFSLFLYVCFSDLDMSWTLLVCWGPSLCTHQLRDQLPTPQVTATFRIDEIICHVCPSSTSQGLDVNMWVCRAALF